MGRDQRTLSYRGRPGGPADDQVRIETDVAWRHARLALQPLDHRLDGEPGDPSGVLGDGGEVVVGEPGEPRVVVADDGDLRGHIDAGAQQGVQDADRAAVVSGEYRGDLVGSGEQGTCGGHAGLL